jgi:cytochrome c5
VNVLSSIKAFGLAAVFAGFAWSVSAATETAADRTKPVGEVCMAGNPCAAAAVAAAGGEPRSGEKVYSTSCFTCHATGAAGAPKTGDAADWNKRLSAHGVDGLYEHAIKGFNAMPAKGLCMDCSDDEIKHAVDHILANSK